MEFFSLKDLRQTFPNEKLCLDYLEKLRWNGIVISPFAENSKVYYCKDHKYKCRDTGKYFNAKTNTIFHNSRIELQKWFIAIWIIAIEKRNITSVGLAKELGITQKTAWHMMQRIKNCYDIKKIAVKKEKKLVSPKDVSDFEVVIDPDRLQMIEWLKMLKK